MGIPCGFEKCATDDVHRSGGVVVAVRLPQTHGSSSTPVSTAATTAPSTAAAPGDLDVIGVVARRR
jgi:hypothetical protein